MANSQNPLNLRKVYPQLPNVTNDTGSMRAWIEIATQILRTLIGDLGVEGHANTIIVTRQDDATQSVPKGLRNGDLWVVLPTKAGQNLARSIWFDGQWVPMDALW